MKIAHTFSWMAAVTIASGMAMVAPAFAQTSANVGVRVGVGVPPSGGGWQGMRPGGPMQGYGIFGNVTAISGNIITVAEPAHPARPMPEQTTAGAPSPAASGVAATATTTVYTVDATNAKIYKGNATTTVSISSIAIGDSVMVQGAVTGTNVTATVIRDGLTFERGAQGGAMGNGSKFGPGMGTSTPSGTPAIQGNGEPVVGGNVTAISGTTITLTNSGNVSYTIDAASTTIVKNGTSTAIGNIAVGDYLVVQGAVNGTSVTASSVIDQGAGAGPGHSPAASAPNQAGGGFGGFLGAIGGFFKHLFGF